MLLIGLIFLRFKSLQKPSVLPSPISTPSFHQEPSQNQPNTYDIQLPQVSLPKVLAIFKVQTATITEEEARSIARVLGIPNEPSSVQETTDGKQFSRQKDNATLTVSQSQIRYKNFHAAKTGTQNLTDLTSKASSLIRNIPELDKTVILNDAKTKYLTITGNHLVNSNSFGQAQFVEFTFDKNLGNFPIVTNYPDTNYLTLGFNKDGDLVYMYARLFENFIPQNSYPIKTQKQAVQELMQGRGKIIQTSFAGSTGPINVKDVKMTNLELAYLLPDKLADVIQPIFVFSGSFEYRNGAGEIIIYLPAISATNF